MHISAGLLAIVAADAEVLVDQQHVGRFPDALFDGDGALDAAGRAMLEDYVKALQDFHERCIDAELPLSFATANGVEVWIASAYALLDPTLKPKVAESWQRLSQMAPDLPEATKMLLKREPSDVDRVYFAYRPRAVLG